jgi:MoaA/NifB/PqqE/SkfB family radical SAM enzyme
MLMTGAEFGDLLGVKSLPNLHLEISLGCNISCSMCTFHDNLKKFRVMSFDQLKKLRPDFERFGQIHIGDGSEPYINPDLLAIVSHLSAHGAKVSVQTNAKLIRTAQDAEKLVNSGLMLLSISLDGIKDATVRKIRGGLSFTEVSRAIDLINAAKVRLNSNTPHLVCNAVAMRSNLDELPELASYLLEQNFCSFRVGFLELRQPNSDLAGELLIYDIPKSIDTLANVKKLIADDPRSMHFDSGLFDVGVGLLRREQCTGYLDRLYVNHAGDMFTCYGKQKLGNIFETGLQELIDSDQYENYKKQVTVPGNTICQACTFCQVMALDKVSDHFGKRSLEYYTQATVEASLSYVAAGGEARDFWRNMQSAQE